MTREELIEHLEHLEKYTHYSEDAPALREVITMLKDHNTEREPGHWIEGHIGDGSGKYILGWDMAKS